MLPVTHGEDVTRRQILLYSVALVAVSAALVPLGVLGVLYLVLSLLLGAAFIADAARLFLRKERAIARALFRYSNIYLGLLGVAMVLDVLLGF
jgi:protoheme IX farnesyltransferase